jgi:hypothetical protein
LATITLGKIEFAFTISGNSPMVLAFPESTSLAAVAGEVVYLSAGQVTEAANSSYVITTSPLLGVLADDGQNTTANLYNAGVYIANQDNVFSANLVNDSGTRIVTHKGYVGATLGLYADTTNSKVYAAGTAVATGVIRPAQVSTTAYPRIRVLALDKRDTEGDTGGRVLFVFMPQHCQLMSTS